MYIRRPTTSTEAQACTGVVQYNRDMCPSQSHVLSDLIEADIGPKCRAILWKDDLEVAFRDLKCMLSRETLLKYYNWKIPFTINIDASDKQLGDIISQNDKPVTLFLRKSSKTHRNYNT